MVRGVVAAALCALGFGPVVTATAQTPRVFTVAGTAARTGEADQPRSGSIASSGPTGLGVDAALAAMPDGGIAFMTLDEVWAVRASGRLERLARRRPLASPSAIVAAPDGSVYVAYERVLAASIRRISPGGDQAVVARAPESCAVRSIDVMADGSLLFASCTSVWRVVPGGVPQRVAGRALDPDPHPIAAGPVPEGSRAVGAAILAPTAVAALPDGGFLFSETQRHVWRVTPDGTIHTFISHPAIGLEQSADGSVFFTRIGRNQPSVVSRRAPDGRTSVIAGTARFGGGFDGDAGNPLDATLDAGGLVVTRDGGVVFTDAGRIRYLPSANPSLLAVGIARPTISTRRRVRVAVATTMPATVTALLVHAGREVIRGRATSTSDGVVIPMARPVPGGVYEVRVRASSAGRDAADALTMVVGPSLPLRYVRRLLVDEAVEFDREERENGGGFLDRIGPCRHFGRARVDCADVGPVGDDHPLCQAIHTYILRPDGLVARGDYGGGADHCQLHARPRYTHRPRPVELPLPRRR